MSALQKLLVIPDQKLIDSQKFLRLFLIWIIGFFALMRTLAMAQFLIDLDYSEVNAVKLTQFVFVRTIIILIMAYFMYLIWLKPHRLALGLIALFSFLSLWNNQDLVSLFSACVVLGLVLRLYSKLYLPVEAQEAVAPPQGLEPPTP
jgi:hypothetical protein